MSPALPTSFPGSHFVYRQYSGLTNMSLDHYFASNFDKYDIPIFRFYGWNPFCLSMGYHQSADTIDKVSLKNDGYEVVIEVSKGKHTVLATKNQLQQIIGQFIENSEEAMPDKGTIKISIDDSIVGFLLSL